MPKVCSRRRSATRIRSFTSSTNFFTGVSRRPCRTDDYIVPIGKADVKRPGNDISVITYGAMVHLALEAAQILAKEGIDLEVVDLRTLIASRQGDDLSHRCSKTSKAIVLHEDNKTGGIGAEIAALLAEECFD